MPAIRGSKSTKKTRRKTRDVDQIYFDDLRQSTNKYRESKAIEDLPALGQFYCTECAKWFDSEQTLAKHQKGKPHKRRLRQLRDEPYTQKEAEAVVGLTTDNGRLEKMAIDEKERATSQHQQITKDTEMSEDDDEEYHAFFSTY